MSTRLLFSSGEDVIPNQFTFTDVTNAQLSTIVSSNTITVTGVSPNTTIIITASGGTVDAGTSGLSGTYASSKTVTSSASGSFVMAARVTSSANYTTAVSCVVTINGVSDTFTVTTRAIDTTPNQFTFTDVSNAAVSTVYPSNTVTVSGVEPNYSFTVTASGGTVDAGTSALSGTYASSKTVTSSASGTFVVAASVTSSSNFSTSVNCVVTVNDVSDTFTVTTRAADTTPNAFTIPDISGVERSTIVTSPTSGFVTVSGLEPNYPITVSSTTAQVDAGTSALSGAWALSKIVTTSASGTLVVAARSTSSSSFNTATNNVITVGAGSDTFTITTRAVDATPDAFSFTDVVGAARSTVTPSNTVTVTGLEPNWGIAVVSNTAGLEVDAGTSALSGTWATSKIVTTDSIGRLVVAARLTSSSSWSTSVSGTVLVGSGSDIFSVTTQSGDTTPDPYSYPDLTAQEINTVVSSTAITFTGTNDNTSWSVTNGEGKLGSSSTWATSGTLAPGDSLTLRTTTPSTSTTTKDVTVNVGGVIDTWSVTTKDYVANAFSFTNVTGAAVSTVYTSSFVTVTGLQPNSSINITASGGTVDAGTSALALSGTFASSKTVTTDANGQFVLAARVTSSSTTNTAVSVNVTVGLSSPVTWSVTTLIDWDPNPATYTFDTINNAEINTIYQSNTITVTGLSPNITVNVSCPSSPASLTIDAGTSSLSGTWAKTKSVTTSSSGTFVLAVKGPSGATYSPSGGPTQGVPYKVSLTKDPGGANATVELAYWTIYSRVADSTPDQFTFTDVTGATRSTAYTSNTVTVTGLSPSLSVTVSASGGTVDAGTSALSGTFAASKTVTTSSTGTIVIATKITSSASYSTAVNSTVTINGVSDVFTVTTTFAPGQVSYTTAGTFSWTCPAGVTSVCAVAVGSGGDGWDAAGGSFLGGGGGGGGLGWKNNISVTPGSSYTVVVLATGNSGASYFISPTLVAGYSGASGGSGNASGGSWVGDGGSTGGSGGGDYGSDYVNNEAGGGGGGAGGYSGGGGFGGYRSAQVNYAGGAGSGGGGGGGGSNNASPRRGGGGGGVGLNGQGTNGSGGASGGAGGGAGSGGTAGASGASSTGNGGARGGGGGGNGTATGGTVGTGGLGGVRIIWGVGRSYPSNAA